MPLGWEVLIVTQWLAIIILIAVVVGVLRQVLPALSRETAHLHPPAFSPLVQGLRVGDALPDFTARDPAGTVVDQGCLEGRGSVLVFLSTGCGPCGDLARQMNQADLGSLSDELVIVTDSADRSIFHIKERLLVLTEHDGSVSAAFGISGRPFAIAVDDTGIVRAARFVNTVRDLGSLADTIRPERRTMPNSADSERTIL